MTLLLSSLMSVGALASDIHPVDPAEAQCENSQSGQTLHALIDTSPVDDVPHDEGDDGHDHHTHSCGSCHIHLVGQGLGSGGFTLVELAKPLLGPNTAAPRDGPSELFRPPRT